MAEWKKLLFEGDAIGGTLPDSDTVLLIKSHDADGSKDFVDSSSAIHTVLYEGDIHHETDHFKYGKSSIHVDGAGDYLDLADNAGWQFNERDFTIDFWAKGTETSDTRGLINYFKDANNRWHLTNYSKLQFYTVVGGSGIEDLASNTPARDTNWHHYAVVRYGDTIQVYVDGVSYISDSFTQNMNVTGGRLYIGARTENGSDFSTYSSELYMDEIRISSIARWTSDFLPPSTSNYEGSVTGINNLGIGTTTPVATLDILGVGSSHKGNLKFTEVAGDVSTTRISIMPYAANNSTINFDAYLADSEAAWVSSNAGSNLQLKKTGDNFYIYYDSAVNVGSAIAWNYGMTMDLTNGNTTFHSTLDSGAFTSTGTVAGVAGTFSAAVQGLSLTSTGGEFYSNGNNIISNSASATTLKIGAADGSDDIQEIRLMTWAGTELLLGDGESSFRGDLAVDNLDVTSREIRTDSTDSLNLGDDSSVISIGKTNEMWVQDSQNNIATLYINHRGYNQGHTQPRSLHIGDGMGNSIASFNGHTHLGNGLSTSFAGSVHKTYTQYLETPDGGVQNCRILEDENGKWVLVGRFAADAALTIQGTWSSVRGLSVDDSVSNVTAFSADWGSSYPSEVRVISAVDFRLWGATRGVDFIYVVSQGQQWKHFLSGGLDSGMKSVDSGARYGFDCDGAYDGRGRWTNPSFSQMRMSDAQVPTHTSAAFTTPTSSAFTWENVSSGDAKLAVHHTASNAGQDVPSTQEVGNDDDQVAFFDNNVTERAQGNTTRDFFDQLWILIKVPHLSVMDSEVSYISSNALFAGTITTGQGNNIISGGDLIVKGDQAATSYSTTVNFSQYGTSWSDLHMGAQGNEWWMMSNADRSASGFTQSGGVEKGVGINFYNGEIRFHTGIATGGGTQGADADMARFNDDGSATFNGAISTAGLSGTSGAFSTTLSVDGLLTVESGDISFGAPSGDSGLWWYADGSTNWGAIYRATSTGWLHLVSQDGAGGQVHIDSKLYANQNALFDANVGVGNTTPQFSLDIGDEAMSSGKKVGISANSDGGAAIVNDMAALILGPLGTRTATTNHYHGGGIAFNHLMRHNTDWDSTYNHHMHAYIGLRMKDTTGSEASHLIFATNSSDDRNASPTERMVIEVDGNVGCGTMAPDLPLQVVRKDADAYPQGEVSAITYSTTPTTFSLLRMGKSNSMTEAHAVTDDGDYLGAIAFQGNDGTAFRSSAHIQAQQDGAASGENVPAELQFQVNSSSAMTTPMVIRASGHIGMGVGNTAPDFPLDVQGSSRFNGYMHFGGSSTGHDVAQFSWASGTFKIHATGSRSLQLGANNSDGHLTIDTSGNATFSGDVTVTGGSLGIGTTATVQSINATTTTNEIIYMVGDSGGANKPFRIQIDNKDDFVEDADRVFIGDGGCSLVLGTANSGFTPTNSYIAMLHGGSIKMGAGAGENEHLTIDTSGNSTFAGTITLERADTNTDASVKFRTSGVEGFDIGYDNVAANTFQIGNESFSQCLFAVEAGGNVGVGQVDPGAKLDVAGTGSFDGNISWPSGSSDTSNNTLRVAVTSGTYNTLIYSDSSNPLSLSPVATGLTSSGQNVTPNNHYSWTYSNWWGKAVGAGWFGLYYQTPSPDPVWASVDMGVNYKKFVFRRWKGYFEWRTGTVNFVIYGSPDNDNWTLLDVLTDPGQNVDRSFNNDAFYRYYKFEWSNQSGNYDWGIKNFEMYGETFDLIDSGNYVIDHRVLEQLNTKVFTKPAVGGTGTGTHHGDAWVADFHANGADYQGVRIRHDSTFGSGGPGPSGNSAFLVDDQRADNQSNPWATVLIKRSGANTNGNIFEVQTHGTQRFYIPDAGNGVFTGALRADEMSCMGPLTSTDSHKTYTTYLQTPDGGVQNCRIIEDKYGKWILVGRFAANARDSIQGIWSSVRGLSTSFDSSTATAFSADWGSSYPSEVRVMGADDMQDWGNTRTIDFIYGCPAGRQWKHFFSGGESSGMAFSAKYGFHCEGAYDGRGRWVNDSFNFWRMADGQNTHSVAGFTSPAADAYNWNITYTDAKLGVHHSSAYGGQDTTLTAGVGRDDSVEGFFDGNTTETNNMGGGNTYDSQVWILIKLPVSYSPLNSSTEFAGTIQMGNGTKIHGDSTTLGYLQMGSSNGCKLGYDGGNGATYFIARNGDVAIGAGGGDALTIDLSKNAIFAADITAYSDIRLKENINTIDSALDKVVKMRGVTFDRIEDGKSGAGVLADELQSIAPELVHDGKYKSVAYGNLTSYLIEAIKELKQEVEVLRGTAS